MQDEEGAQPELQPIRPGFFKPNLSMRNPNNREPDYMDPDWFEKVSDWDEFWNYTRWDLEAANDDFDEEYDVAGHPTRTLEHARRMIDAFKQIEGRHDVVNIPTSYSRRQHVDVYDNPPVTPEVQPELPAWDLNDARAFADKQHRKTLMDIEWRRRQAKIGRQAYPHKDVTHDSRYREFDYLGETFDWSHEDIYAVITHNGTACRPEDHKAHVENPLIPVDYVNTMGVTHIEEVEDFLDRIGHLGKPPPKEQMEAQVMKDLLENSPVPAVSAMLLHNILADMDAADAAKQRREEGNTWMGDS